MHPCKFSFIFCAILLFHSLDYASTRPSQHQRSNAKSTPTEHGFQATQLEHQTQKKHHRAVPHRIQRSIGISETTILIPTGNYQTTQGFQLPTTPQTWITTPSAYQYPTTTQQTWITTPSAYQYPTTTQQTWITTPSAYQYPTTTQQTWITTPSAYQYPTTTQQTWITTPSGSSQWILTTPLTTVAPTSSWNVLLSTPFPTNKSEPPTLRNKREASTWATTLYDWNSNYSTSTGHYPQWNTTFYDWYSNYSTSTGYYPQWNTTFYDWYSNYSTATGYYPEWNYTDAHVGSNNSSWNGYLTHMIADLGHLLSNFPNASSSLPEVNGTMRGVFSNLSISIGATNVAFQNAGLVSAENMDNNE